MATFWIENGALHAKDLIPGSLEDSIKKWEILLLEIMHGNLVLDGGGSTCALCHKYTSVESCAGCPVLMYTGYTGCIYTPYADYLDACVAGDAEAAQSAAEEMVEFLEILLEEGF